MSERLPDAKNLNVSEEAGPAAGRMAMLIFFSSLLAGAAWAAPVDVPGGIGDPAGVAALIRRPDAALEAITLAKGRVLWTVPAPATPVAWLPSGALLIAAGNLCLLDSRTGAAHWRAPLPPGVPQTEQYSMHASTTLQLRFTALGTGGALEWEAMSSRVYGIMRQESPQRSAGSLTVDLATGRLGPVVPNSTPWPPSLGRPTAPPTAVTSAAAALSGVTNINPLLVGTAWASLVRVDERRRVVLHRWSLPDGGAAPVVELPVRPGGTGQVIASASEDTAHLVVGWQLPAAGVQDWEIFTVATATRWGRLKQLAYPIRFVVAGDRALLRIEDHANYGHPSARLAAFNPKGRQVWSRPVWTYPEFPPVP